MKILFVISGALRTLGGALISTLIFARKLERDFGHCCVVLTRHPLVRRETIGGIEITAFRDVEELKHGVAAFRPDVIVGALNDAIDALRVAKSSGIPAALYLHSYEFCPPTAAERGAWSIAAESTFATEAEADFVFGEAKGVFACSRHLQQVLEAKRRLSSEVIPCDFDAGEVMLDAGRPDRAEYISGVCGYRHKGLEIFLNLAERFGAERFLLAGALGADIDLSYRSRLAALPNVLLPGRMALKDMLVRSKIVLVPSQWPEPFGRIAVEAMANGIPVLASDAGGLQEILGDAPMRVADYRDADIWTERLADLIGSPDRRAMYAREGKIRARPFLEGNSTVTLENRLRRLCEERASDFRAHAVIAFHGAPARAESDSLVNARWSEALGARHGFSPRFNPSRFDLPDVIVHHDYTVPFTDFTPPDSGALVAVRTSDFGPYPPAWTAKINREFDQLWVYTDWIRQQAITSGIAPERVRLVPLGVDAEIFRPEGPRSALPTRKSFRFLFVGTAVVRKGFDILLAAYLDAFTRDDDVSLVIKDHSGNAFHSPTYRAEIEGAIRNPKAPEILYIDNFLPSQELAALYRACNVGVFPYRAEGFCLPILEAMACGTPSIVPERGACRDFCSEETSFLVPAVRVQLPVNRRFALKIGVEEDIAAVDFSEVRVESLMRTMKEVRALGRERLARKADAGVRVAHGRFTWERSAERAAHCLRELQEKVPLRLQRSRRESEQAYRRFEAARRLLLDRKVPRASAPVSSTATRA
jgi:glycosyltransferase involved in cell wall biosynthesis